MENEDRIEINTYGAEVEDEGHFTIALMRDEGKIVIDFSRTVEGITLNGAAAIEIGQLLVKYGSQIGN